MKKKNVEISFKKLLGNGRAWKTPVGFTAELLEVLVSPLSELKERFVKKLLISRLIFILYI